MKKQILVGIEPELLEKLTEYVASLSHFGASRNAIVCLAITEYLKRTEGK